MADVHARSYTRPRAQEDEDHGWLRQTTHSDLLALFDQFSTGRMDRLRGAPARVGRPSWLWRPAGMTGRSDGLRLFSVLCVDGTLYRRFSVCRDNKGSIPLQELVSTETPSSPGRKVSIIHISGYSREANDCMAKPDSCLPYACMLTRCRFHGNGSHMLRRMWIRSC